jgi:F0F1-type ATP synthase membrane subunit b/b'
MCNCKRNENGQTNNRDVEAVMNKLDRIVADANDKLQEVIADIPAKHKQEIEKITKDLFDNMSKEDIVNGILDNDVLSFKNLMAREDVKDAIDKSEAILNDGYNMVAEVTLKLFDADQEYNPIMEAIVDDTIIFGINDDIRNRIVKFEADINSIVADIIGE